MFKGVGKSTRLEHAGKSLSFPCLEDYCQHLAAAGQLGSGEDVRRRPDLVRDIQVDWHKNGQTGCVFARILSQDPTGNQWKIVPLVGAMGWSQGEWETRVRDMVRAAMKDPAVWLVSLLFPDVANPGQLRPMLERLVALDGWSMEASAPAAVDSRGEVVNVALRLDLGDGVSSWVLGLAPFDSMPFTRRAPFTEVVLAVKPKGPTPLHHEANTKAEQAHVADAPVPVAPVAVDAIWQKTKANKLLLLKGGGDPTARAKVTFSVPAASWRASDPTSQPEVARA